MRAARRRSQRRTATSVSVLLLALTAILGAGASSAWAACANPVACENALPGDPPSDWQVDGVGDGSIQGFATSMSVNAGSTVSFKINTPSTAYHIDILRLGYYQGNGARKVAANLKPSATLPQTQPACLTDSSTGLIDCGNWGVSASWTVPSNAVSGVYLAHLVRDDSQDPGGDGEILFVVRNDASHSDMVVSTSDATWEAYNNYGGNSLYTCSVACPPGNPFAYKGADAVSYNRPFDGAFYTDNGASYFFYAEYQMIRFLERNGYDVSYMASPDLERAGSLLKNHKLFVSSGHDEYWSAGQRASVTAARDAGVNLAFFSGNEMFWKTRWGPSIDGSNTAYRTLTSYKETHYTAPADPQDPPTWTGTWEDPRWSPPADGGQPQNAVTGQFFNINGGTADIVVPYQYSKLRIWRNTGVAKLLPGQSLTLGAGIGTLGYEWDLDVDNGFRPRGEFDLSSTTASNLQAFTDYGTTVANNSTATHHLTLYRAPSGALVFGAGTVQWSWGLDNTNAWGSGVTDPSGLPPDPNMQQATVNMFADMGIQPTTLMSGLLPASSSSDTTPPTSTITSPTTGATVPDGTQTTISGTAVDAGGGVVAGVEVSPDGGAHWHPATGTTNWSYTWIPHGNPATTILSRAVDDSGNLEKPSAGVTVNIACPCSLWGTQVPDTIDSGDTGSVEVGVKFKSDAFGQITGIRFYKASANTGTHVGDLWTTGGQLLARATFTGESASGWQQVTFSSPVVIQPNTIYVASYLAPKGHYSASSGYFYPPPSPPPLGGGSVDSPPLHAIPNLASGDGVYSYNTSPTFPVSTFGAANYWVDVMFTPIPAPGAVSGVTGTAGYDSANLTWSAPSTGGTVTQYTITPYIGTTAQTSTTITGTPPATGVTLNGLTQGTSYTFTVQASNPNGAGPAATSNSVTPTGPSAPSAPIGVTATPATGQALVAWTPPNSNGSTITGYTITPYIGTTAQTPVQVGNGSATSGVVSALTNGVQYTFVVTATNGLGTGPASSASPGVTPSDTIFNLASPPVLDSGDGSSVELGVKFTADATGQIAGIRFYKSAANTGVHIGSLWTTGGSLLASATFTNESAAGWQYAAFASPVSVSAGTTYVAGYFAPNGHYSFQGGGLSSAIDSPPLHAVANGTSADGVYAYGTGTAFPGSSYNASNYWVDVLFMPTPPGQVTNVAATATYAGAKVSWSAPSAGGAAKSYTVIPYVGPTAQAPTTVNGSPPATTATINGLTVGTPYTFTVQATNDGGAGLASAQSSPVVPHGPSAPDAPSGVSASPATREAVVSWTPGTTNGSPITGYTVTPYIGSAAQSSVQVSDGSATSALVTSLNNGVSYTFTVTATNGIGTGPASAASTAVTPRNTLFDFATPTTIDSGDSSSIELGVKFTADTSGSVTGVRFYKAAANTGTHVGSLWDAGGHLLASATFTNETASGWQYVTFASPVALAAGTTYVAAYFAPSGHYSYSSGALSSGFDNAPLHAVPNGASPNGVFGYFSTSAFPANSYNAANYWVDALFVPSPPGQATSVTATAGIQSASVSWTAPASGGVTKYTVTPYAGSTAGTPTIVTGSPPATGVTVNGLTAGTAYTFTVTASNATGDSPPSAPSNSVTPTAASVPSAPTGVTATPANGQALVRWTPPPNNGSAITAYTVTPYAGSAAGTPVQVNNGSATSAVVTGLTDGTTYTFSVSATNGVGTGPPSAQSSGSVPDYTLFDFATPATIDSGDGGSIELGVKFTADKSGSIAGIRFYKAAANTGTHVASLWDASGNLLATATFTGESASGWQYVPFTSAVAITAGTTYVAGYFAPNGHYSATPAGFGSPLDNPPLHAVGAGTSPNGVYAVASASTFPTNSYNATNYWIDVLFSTP
jgi:hypothetical protein